MEIDNIVQADSGHSMPERQKHNKSLAIRSLVFGIIGTIFSIGIGLFFLFLFALFIGFILISKPLYIIICSVIALIGVTLGVISIILGIKAVKHNKIISILGMLSGFISTSVGILDLYMFYINATF